MVESRTVARVDFGESSIRFTVSTTDPSYSPSATVPRGWADLRRDYFSADPPRPEDLTNAIGDVADFLDDVTRELPALLMADEFRCVGPMARTVAAVEVGSGSALAEQYVLTRDAAEDVFRTVATEAPGARAMNPGLPAEAVDTIVAGCCALVAVMRTLHLDRVIVEAEDPT